MKCKALFCIAEEHEPDMIHVDVTGTSWEEDTSEYEGPVIAHIITTEDETK